MQMFESFYEDGAWDNGSIVPYHTIELSPAANILNYGQGVFEGMKAYRSVRDTERVVMFRPQMNAQRFARSSREMAIPPFPEDRFMDAVRKVVSANADYVPLSQDGSQSLYLRPLCIGIEPMLGVRASNSYLFYIFASPVGPYFPGVGVVKLLVTDIHRAAAHGSGAAKAVSNYAVTMRPKIEANEQGFDGVIFLDTVHNRYVEEAGAANFFALMDDNTLVTPKLGSILPGITRESILKVASEMFGMNVEERLLDIEEVCLRARECFVCGTGAIITSVSEIGWRGKVYPVNKNDYRMAQRVYDKLIGIQLQREEDPFGWVEVIV